MTSDTMTAVRRRMVHEQIERRGIHDAELLAALRTVPRHRFVPLDQSTQAYADQAVALGPGQTVSQPFVVALMTEQVLPTRRHRALEVGTGSGYQAAILAELFGEVFTIECDAERSAAARETLAALHYRNVRTLVGDGRAGVPEHAPFDAILVTAACPEAPRALFTQLTPGGVMVYPRGPVDGDQILVRVERVGNDAFDVEELSPVRFVPLRHDP